VAIEAAITEVDTTATATGMRDITAGMGAGAGSLAGTIRGGCFSHRSLLYRFLTLITVDTDMARGMDTVQATGTDTDRNEKLFFRSNLGRHRRWQIGFFFLCFVSLVDFKVRRQKLRFLTVGSTVLLGSIHVIFF
jgi:hypothetical protein